LIAEYLLDNYEWTPGIDNRENEANDGKWGITGRAQVIQMSKRGGEYPHSETRLIGSKWTHA
jgi:hypothetical protein